MQIIADESFTCDRSVVALGMFDGVHIGHRVLLQRARALADQRGVPLIVRTFLEHPLQVIAPEKCPPRLCTFEERNALMEEMGVDVLVAQPFTRDTMELLPETVKEPVLRVHRTGRGRSARCRPGGLRGRARLRLCGRCDRHRRSARAQVSDGLPHGRGSGDQDHGLFLHLRTCDGRGAGRSG